MLLNDDLSKRTLVHAGSTDWIPSPMEGVDRRMLFRVGEETARATSIVRYAPESHFSHHGHPGGEEFLVLDGVFQDESGDFPAGTYVRNPPGSGHAPKSDDGCTILVKLLQFKASDQKRVVRLPGEAPAGRHRDGVKDSWILFDGSDELVMMEDWEPGADVEVSNERGLELLVLDGSLTENGDNLERWSWLRLPAGRILGARTGVAGARVWFKAAPLLHDDVCAFDAPRAKER